MAETHVISALTAKRSELAGLVAFHGKEVARLSEEIKALDAAIKLFEPSYRIESIRAKRFIKKNSFFRAGEANRSILDVIREAKEPVSTNQIAEKLAAAKGFSKESLDALKATTLTTLHRQRKNGLVRMAGKDEAGVCCWELVS
jgi:hypothetical protein